MVPVLGERSVDIDMNAPTSDADEKYYRELHTRISSRSKSPAPKGKGKGVCRQWQIDGSCRFGTECRYKHDEGAAAPATKAQGRSSSRGSSRGRKKKTSAAAPVTNGSSQPSVAGAPLDYLWKYAFRGVRSATIVCYLPGRGCREFWPGFGPSGMRHPLKRATH